MDRMHPLGAENDRINEIDHEAIMYATNHPWEAQGWLERYLVRVRASHPDRLPSLPPVK
jgi:xylose isomerase